MFSPEHDVSSFQNSAAVSQFKLASYSELITNLKAATQMIIFIVDQSVCCFFWLINERLYYKY